MPERCALLALLVLAGCAAHDGLPSPAAGPTAISRLKEPATQLRFARQMEAQGDIATALQLYRDVLAGDPNNVEALDGAARLVSGAGAPEAAGPYLAKLALLRPRDPSVPLRQAQAFNAANEPKAALERLTVAERLGATSAEVLAERGLALDLSGAGDAARIAYGGSLQAEPNQPQVVRRLALSLAIGGDYGAALSLLQGVANDPAGAGDVRRTLALIYALSGQVDESEAIAKTAMPPDTARALRPFYARLAGLSAVDKAIAVHFNRLPAGALPTTPEPTAPTAPAAGPPDPPPAPVATAAESPPLVSVGKPGARQGTQGAAPATLPGFAGKGEPEAAWLQLASLSNGGETDKEWAQIRRRTGALLRDVSPVLETARVGEKTRIRLLVGPFRSVADAQAWRRALEERGQRSALRTDAGAHAPAP